MDDDNNGDNDPDDADNADSYRVDFVIQTISINVFIIVTARVALPPNGETIVQPWACKSWKTTVAATFLVLPCTIGRTTKERAQIKWHG
jgi:hypothetical protein